MDRRRPPHHSLSQRPLQNIKTSLTTNYIGDTRPPPRARTPTPPSEFIRHPDPHPSLRSQHCPLSFRLKAEGRNGEISAPYGKSRTHAVPPLVIPTELCERRNLPREQTQTPAARNAPHPDSVIPAKAGIQTFIATSKAKPVLSVLEWPPISYVPSAQSALSSSIFDSRLSIFLLTPHPRPAHSCTFHCHFAFSFSILHLPPRPSHNPATFYSHLAPLAPSL